MYSVNINVNSEKVSSPLDYWTLCKQRYGYNEQEILIGERLYGPISKVIKISLSVLLN